MSLISTESWVAFAQHIGDDSAAVANPARTAIAKAYRVAGYSYETTAVSAGWLVRKHPVSPERSALVWSASTSNAGTSAIRKKVSNNTGVVIGGFSIFIPGSFVPDTAAAPEYPFLGVNATADGATMLSLGSPALAAGEIFRVRYDLGIGYGIEVQSAKKITPGKLSYLEYRLTQSEIRVWLDDVLVIQKSVALDNSNITFVSNAWSPAGRGSSMSEATGQWAISDWYNLKEDADSPNVRLGPTTRVVGVRADSDDFVQFARPSGFASNADVVAQGLNPDALNYLKTDTVGVQDIYNPPSDSATATAAIIHGMSVKVVAQNVESLEHTMSPLLVSNGTAQGEAVTLSATLGPITTLSTVDPNTGEAWTPAAAAIAKFGVKLET